MLSLSRSLSLATLMVLASCTVVFAQGNPATGAAATNRGEIRGRVVEAAGRTAIRGAIVDVADSGATTPAASTFTDDNGVFRFRGLAPGTWRVRVRAIGYAARRLPLVEVRASSPAVDVGTVALTSAPVELQEISVAERRELAVDLAPDRNTYTVRDMPNTRGGTALDVLRNVPSVDVDIDNIVSLRGNTGVIVQINGRPSPMKPAQLGTFLAQLRAEMVDKVEIVTNPSARENPEGDAGIINIVLKQRSDAGTSGALTLGGGTTGHADVGGNLGYSTEPLSLFGSYGFLRDRGRRNESIFRENTYLSPVTFLEETGARRRVPLAHALTGSAEFQAGEHDNLSLDLLYSTRRQSDSYGLLYRDLDSARTLTGLRDRLTSSTGHEDEFETTLGYEHEFEGRGHKLKSELRLVRSNEGGPSSVLARDLTLAGSPADTSALETQAGWEYPDETALKVDYTRPLGSLLHLSAGYQAALERFHTTLDTRVFDTAQAVYLPDSTRISDFNYRQMVHAAYAMLDLAPGRFQLQGGVRVERATTQFHLRTTGATYDNPYNSVFPSAIVAYNIDDNNQVKLSYSSRIRRPDDPDVLDPTIRYADPLNVSRGNPYLKPEYAAAFELGFQRTAGRTTLQLTPYYRHTRDAVVTFRSIDSAGVLTRTFANVGSRDAYGFDATLARNGGWLRGFVSASAFRQVSNGAGLAPGLNASGIGWTVRTNTSLHLSSTLDMQALISYQAPLTVEQGRNASRTRFSFAARKKLAQNRLSLTLRVIDPFNTSRERFTATDPRFNQVQVRRSLIRGLLLSATWTFGHPPRSGRDDLIGNEPGAP